MFKFGGGFFGMSLIRKKNTINCFTGFGIIHDNI